MSGVYHDLATHQADPDLVIVPDGSCCAGTTSTHSGGGSAP